MWNGTVSFDFLLVVCGTCTIEVQTKSDRIFQAEVARLGRLYEGIEVDAERAAFDAEASRFAQIACSYERSHHSAKATRNLVAEQMFIDEVGRISFIFDTLPCAKMCPFEAISPNRAYSGIFIGVSNVTDA